MKLPKSSFLASAALVVAAASTQGAIIFTEDFETFAEGAISTVASDSFDITNGFNVRQDFWAVEGPGTDPAGAGNNGANLFDAINTRGFGLRDLDDDDNPGPPNYITFDAIDTTGYSDFSFSFDVTNEVTTGNTTSSDELRVIFDLNYDGITFDADETYTLTGNGSGALTDGTSTAVQDSFVNFSHSLVGVPTGDLGIRIQAISFTDGGDRVTFDNIEVSAVPEPSTFALLAGIGALGLVLYRRRQR